MRPFAPCFGELVAGAQVYLVDHSCYLRSRISTTSAIVLPRPITSRLPSRDKSKLSICSLLKWVICFGVPPVIDWLQILSTPPSFLV
jgi:hypothetical protein